MSTTYPHSEIGLSKKLGVSRQILTGLRDQLKKGEDWDTESKSIQWSHKAAQWAAFHLGVELPSEEKTPVVASPVNGNGHVESMLVTRRITNPTFIEAQRADGSRVLVKVQRNTNFRPAMSIQAARISATDWRLVGRTPRFPGRW
jgi:hypothetical protein